MNNPWMSMWLSAANQSAGTARGLWMEQAERHQQRFTDAWTKAWMEAWTKASMEMWTEAWTEALTGKGKGATLGKGAWPFR